MKFKIFDYVLLGFLILSIIFTILLINDVNIIQFIALTLLFSILWSLLSARLVSSDKSMNKMVALLILALSSLVFILLLYKIVWNYLPMQRIEQNTHFGPSESVSFNTNAGLGTYIANYIQQFVISLVFYGILQVIARIRGKKS
jgi:hypothetical protein